MITEISCDGIPCFGTTGQKLAALQKINVVDGPNGSGKTSISRLLASGGPSSTVIRSAQDVDVRVFNRTYINEVLASPIPGVFVLGDGAEGVVKRISELEGEKGEIPQARKKLEKKQKTLGTDAEPSSVRGQIVAAEAAAREGVWSAKAAIDESIREALHKTPGAKSAKDRFFELVLRVAATLENDQQLPELGDLIEQARSFEGAAEPVHLLPKIPAADLASLPGAALLGESIVGSVDVSLSDLIDRLGSADWVDQGRGFIDSDGDPCPFCQQATPLGFMRDLEEYFDIDYAAKKSQLENLADEHGRAFTTMRQAISDLTRNAALTPEERDSLEEKGKLLEAAVDSNERVLNEKKAAMAAAVTAVDVSAEAQALGEVIAAINSRLREHNDRITNRKTAEAKWESDCWAWFVATHALPVLAVRAASLRAPSAAAKALTEDIEALVKGLATKQAELLTLKAQIKSSTPLLESMNKTLASVGFTSFELGEEPDHGGYRLVRPGQPANDPDLHETLSEGERNFVAFLYYFTSLFGEPGEGENDCWISVIDDPISSLDSDIMFAASTMVAGLIQQILAGEGRCIQLILLTHNTFFHREATYNGGNAHSKDWQFFRIRKSVAGNTIDSHGQKNPIQGTYEMLWEVVRGASQQTGVPVAYVQTTMRRIVESYFRLVGGWNADTVKAATNDPVERSALVALRPWVNSGVHFVGDDLEYTPSGVTVDIFLEAFRKLFEATGHENHYLMMMQLEGASAA